MSCECDCCGKSFPSNYEYSPSGCCSTVKDDHIECGYGSEKYHLMKVSFIESRPDNVKIDQNICDDCLTLFIEKGICGEGEPFF